MTRLALAVAAIAAGVLAACSAPPLTLVFEIAGGSGGTCPSTACSDIPMTCEAMVFVRILAPNQPDQPFLSQCLPVLETPAHPDLCPIAGVQLSPDDADGKPIQLPEQTLEVQVVVLPFAAGSDGKPDCDPAVAGLQFAATGLPEANASSPPVGGRAYYHPGDRTTVVELGCNDLAPLNDGSNCSTTSSLVVDAVVDDFATDLPVTASVADQLTVSVGEPIQKPGGVGSDYVLESSGSNAAKPLTLTGTDPTPSWQTTTDQMFDVATCIEVLESGAQTTATLACHQADHASSTLDFDGKTLPAGIHLPRQTLDDMIAALADKTFTLDQGLVLGIVLDGNGSPLANQTVDSSGPNGAQATVRYLTSDGAAFTGTATSANGIFVSTDAAFETVWTSQNGTLGTSAFGGLVDGLVTIVVLQFPSSSHS
jgi:hypothetical protein|nr:hypothetical protein [Kofleriaceae bacterium]